MNQSTVLLGRDGAACIYTEAKGLRRSKAPRITTDDSLSWVYLVAVHLPLDTSALFQHKANCAGT